MKKNKSSIALVVIGIILIICSVSLAMYNILEDYQAGKKSEQVLDELVDKIVIPEEPSYLVSDQIEMPTVTIDKNRYIGILNLIPLGIELPILGDWNYNNLKIAPSRYKGSLYLNNLIIAGHGYVSHFKKIKNLKIGNHVTFTDMEGNVFEYEVINIEVIDQYDTEKMEAGEWDLTLFTCTSNNTKRATIRLKKI